MWKHFQIWRKVWTSHHSMLLRPHRNVNRAHWWRRWRMCGGSLLWCWLPGLLPAPLQQGHWQAGGPPILHFNTLSTSLPATPSSTTGQHRRGWRGPLHEAVSAMVRKIQDVTQYFPRMSTLTERYCKIRAFSWERVDWRTSCWIFFCWTDCGYFSIFWIYE